MKTIYLAQMKWCERENPVCAGTNKRKTAIRALQILKEEYGHGPVNRGQAFCSVPITHADILVTKIPFNPCTGPCICHAVGLGDSEDACPRENMVKMEQSRNVWKARAEAAEAENAELRKLFPAILQALCSGCVCTETSSLDFLKGIPKEVAAVVDGHRAEIAEMRNKLEFYAGGQSE